MPVLSQRTKNSVLVQAPEIDLTQKESGDMSVTFVLAQLELIQTDGNWTVASWTRHPLAELPSAPNTPFLPPHAEAMVARNRAETLPQVESAVLSTDDYAAVEEIAAWWVSAIRTCNPTPFYEQCLDREDSEGLLFDVVRPVRGMEGFWEQCHLMIDMDKKQPKRQGNHTLNTPWVILSPDGQEAEALWYDFGWTMMAEAFGCKESPYPAMPAQGRYRMNLVRRPGGWKVRKLHWDPLFQHGVLTYDHSHTVGWSASPLNIRWPSLFDSWPSEASADTDEFAYNPIEQYLPTT